MFPRCIWGCARKGSIRAGWQLGSRGGQILGPAENVVPVQLMEEDFTDADLKASRSLIIIGARKVGKVGCW